MLSGQVQYRVLDTVALRADYVHLTDKLIHLICREIATTGRPVELVFLDKSGRPVAWLASHPPIPRRIEAIEALERRWNLPAP